MQWRDPAIAATKVTRVMLNLSQLICHTYVHCESRKGLPCYPFLCHSIVYGRGWKKVTELKITQQQLAIFFRFTQALF